MTHPPKQYGDLLSTSQPCLACQHELQGQPTYTQPHLPTPLIRCPECHFCQPVGDLLEAAEAAFPDIANATDYLGILTRLAMILIPLALIVFLIIKIF